MTDLQPLIQLTRDARKVKRALAVQNTLAGWPHLQLSRDRAASVADESARMGVRRDRIVIDGLGDDERSRGVHQAGPLPFCMAEDAGLKIVCQPCAQK